MRSTSHITLFNYNFPTNVGTAKSSASQELYTDMNQLFENVEIFLSEYTRLYPVLPRKDRLACNRISKQMLKKLKDIKINFLNGFIQIEEQNLYLYSFLIFMKVRVFLEENEDKFREAFSFHELASHHWDYVYKNTDIEVAEIFTWSGYLSLYDNYYSGHASL